MGVPFVATDLVGRAGTEPHDMKRVKADLGVGDGGADGALVFAAQSIEIARIDCLRSPSASKKPCKVALLRPGEHHTIAPLR